ncbi:hypothetical protein PINS_up009578 [Pythium insidiosum]|nr:hypothetical protein PINS_up009578 [Pythium insidiosum]
MSPQHAHEHAPSDHACEFFSPSCEPGEFWLYLSICLALITTAGLMAGLTTGLLSLDMLNMRILEMEGSADEKRWAARVLPILSKHHFLLVTLMLVNAGANEALPIFLSRLVPESVSIILSVTCVLLFGEILPSAVFTGPSQLRIAATLTPIVKVLMGLVSPIAYPIAKLLDWFLGADHDVVKYKRKELKALVALQRETDALRRSVIEHDKGHAHGHEHHHHHHHHHVVVETPSGSSPLTHRRRSSSGLSESSVSSLMRENSAFGTRLHVDEVTIIHGALDLSAKTVQQVMIPIEKVYMLELDTKLDDNTMAEILASGHSRIPIYKKYRSNIVGLLLVKRLIVVDPEDERPIRDLVLRKPIVVTPDESCYHILNEFQKGRSHIALVTKDAKHVMQCWRKNEDIPADVSFVGIITIEDVIEELIQEEIEDESDVYVHDMLNYWQDKAKRKAGSKLPFVKRQLKALAERARKRVRNRRAGKKENALSPLPIEPPLEIKVVTECTPLLATAPTTVASH